MKSKRNFDWALYLGIVFVGAGILTLFLYTNWQNIIGFIFAMVSLTVGVFFISTKNIFEFSKRTIGLYFLFLGLTELFLVASTKSKELGWLLLTTLIIGQTIFLIIYKYKKSMVS